MWWGVGRWRKEGDFFCFNSHNDCLQKAQWNKHMAAHSGIKSVYDKGRGEGGQKVVKMILRKQVPHQVKPIFNQKIMVNEP